tara:strand:- start:922 stop:1452 length:531 start_codon:yes stop_codon:yes gene_type:complete
MERRLAGRIREHEMLIKNNIQKWLSTNNCNVMDNTGNNKTSDFLQYVYDTEPLELTAVDFLRRKRVKNDAPYYERCIAKRADGNQCTRRKRGDCVYCGTHLKGTPHGTVVVNNETVEHVKKIEVWVEDINGIQYYIDAEGNVYDHKDIIDGSKTPNVIAQYEKSESGVYSIPSLSS